MKKINSTVKLLCWRPSLYPLQEPAGFHSKPTTLKSMRLRSRDVYTVIYPHFSTYSTSHLALFLDVHFCLIDQGFSKCHLSPIASQISSNACAKFWGPTPHTLKQKRCGYNSGLDIFNKLPTDKKNNIINNSS